MTSIINRYRHSPLAPQAAAPALSSGSFYYDYTEEFENAPEYLITLPSPLAPIPTRALSTHRPMVLNDDCDARLEARAEGQRGTPTPGSGRRLPGQPARDQFFLLQQAPGRLAEYARLVDYVNQEDFPAQIERRNRGIAGSGPADAFLAHAEDKCLGFIACQSPRQVSGPASNDGLLFSEQLSAASKSPQRQVEIQSPGKATIRSVQATILGADDQMSIRTYSLSTIMDKDDGTAHLSTPADTCRETDTGPNIAQDYSQASLGGVLGPDTSRPQLERRGRKFYSLDPALSDLASLVKNFDYADELSLPGDDADSDAKSLREGGQDASHDAANEKYSPCTTESDVSGSAAEEGVAGLLWRHHNTQSLLDANTQETNENHAASINLALTRSETPMLAPKPISPAKELRVKNSIPQLMKALPPLPGDIVDCGQQPYSESSPEDFGTPSGRLLVKPNASVTPRSTRNAHAAAGGNEPTEQAEDGLQKPWSPKFKVRLANATSASTGTVESRPWNKDKNYPWTTQAPDIKLTSICADSPRPGTGKPRLRLKVSRNPLAEGSSESLGTVRRIVVAESSPAISDIAFQPPKDLFTPPSHGAEAFPTLSPGGVTRVETIFPTHPTSRSDYAGRSDPHFDTPRPSVCAPGDDPHRGASLDTHLETMRRPSVSTHAAPSERGTFLSERSNLRKRRVLRKKFSILTRKDSGTPSKEESSDDVTRLHYAEPIAFAAVITPTENSADEETARKTSKVRTGRLRQKFTKWMRGAKHVVSVCVGRRRVHQGI